MKVKKEIIKQIRKNALEHITQTLTSPLNHNYSILENNLFALSSSDLYGLIPFSLWRI